MTPAHSLEVAEAGLSRMRQAIVPPVEPPLFRLRPSDGIADKYSTLR
jgi:hypothetical protein